MQGEQGCIGPQARVKSSVSSECEGKDLLSQKINRWLGHLHSQKYKLLAGSAWLLAVSTETMNWARIRPGGNLELGRVGAELGQRRELAREDTRLKAKIIE